MTNPVTPNIGLNKIDRTSPATTYFDLEKYIDQNADTVDRFAGEASQAIEALQQRLDTEERREVVLQPGLQIVNAERSAPFSLRGIKGRTLVNLAGRMSNRSVNDPAVTTLSVGNGTTGRNTETINVSVKNTNEGYIVFRQVDGKEFTLIPDNYYLISMDVKVNSISGPGQLKAGATWYGAVDVDNTSTGVWQRVYHSFKATAERTFLHPIVGTCYAGDVFATANFDVRNVSLYEISKADYDELPSLSESQKNIEYPYVDSVQPVRNPYATRYGENLLPPFYEASYRTKASRVAIVSPYELAFQPGGDGDFTALHVPVIPYCDYTFSYEHEGYSPAENAGLAWGVTGEDYMTGVSGYTYDLTGTFNVGNRHRIAVVFRSFDTSKQTSCRNPMLTLSPTPKPFKPREDSMLALQTDLYADPATGENADEVFEKDGQYFKMAKWKKVVLDGALNWTIGPSSAAGYRQVQVTSFPGNAVPGSGIVTKFNGKIIPQGSTVASPDVNAISSDGNFYISISNTDSGWGDGYTPTPDEIKAYFMGWVMRDMSAGPYTDPTGVAQKTWTPIGYTPPANWNSTWVHLRKSVPVSEISPSLNDKTITLYQLVYQLATPTVEPIVSEGMLTFNEGLNQVEIGTGIVFREPIAAVKDGGGRWNLGNTLAWTNAPGFKNKARDIIGVYKNSRLDTGWVRFITDKVGAAVQEPSPNALYDPTATYTVTYRMLDNSPIVPFSGSYTTNEKAMLQELTNVVQQNTSAVSVLINKKADKDAPGWITPTLLNGWASRNTGYDAPLSYRKIDGLGVQVRGIIQLGTTGTVFFLPDGYRPEKTHFCNVMGYMQSQASYIYPYITVTPDGDFRIDAVTSPPTWLIIDTIIPL